MAIVAVDLGKRNDELKRALDRSRRREEEALRELDRARERLRQAEEAEERLCSEVGDLEAEAFHRARAFLVQIRSLTEQISSFRQLSPLA
ncbi:protein RESPONSE TO LOW SULFUR 4-like [Wolffia australiana]